MADLQASLLGGSLTQNLFRSGDCGIIHINYGILDLKRFENCCSYTLTNTYIYLDKCCTQESVSVADEEPTGSLPSEKREARLRKFRELHFKRVSLTDLHLYLTVIISQRFAMEDFRLVMYS